MSVLLFYCFTSECKDFSNFDIYPGHLLVSIKKTLKPKQFF